jgi:hypothetical protein
VWKMIEHVVIATMITMQTIIRGVQNEANEDSERTWRVQLTTCRLWYFTGSSTPLRFFLSSVKSGIISVLQRGPGTLHISALSQDSLITWVSVLFVTGCVGGSTFHLGLSSLIEVYQNSAFRAAKPLLISVVEIDLGG